jgi:hypothetical protein
MDAAGVMMLFLALVCTFASWAVAGANQSAEGPTSEEDFIVSTPKYFILQARDVKLDMEEADRITDP